MKQTNTPNTINNADEFSLFEDQKNDQGSMVERNRMGLARLFHRYGFRNNKFTIAAIDKSLSSIIITGGDTRMDIIYQHLVRSNDVSNDDIFDFVKYIGMEQYDTESLFDDIGDEEQSGMLNNKIRNIKKCFIIICEICNRYHLLH